jgi:NAD+ synthase
MTINSFRLAVAQLNPTVGDVAGNAELVRQARADAKAQQADLVLTSELMLAGYPPEDLVLKPAFVRECMETARALAEETGDGGPAVDPRNAVVFRCRRSPQRRPSHRSGVK